MAAVHTRTRANAAVTMLLRKEPPSAWHSRWLRHSRDPESIAWIGATGNTNRWPTLENTFFFRTCAVCFPLARPRMVRREAYMFSRLVFFWCGLGRPLGASSGVGDGGYVSQVFHTSPAFQSYADSEGRVATRWTDGWPCALFSRPNFHRQCRGQVPILHGSNLASDGQSGNLSEGDKRDSKGDMPRQGRLPNTTSKLAGGHAAEATLLRSQHLGLGRGGPGAQFCHRSSRLERLCVRQRLKRRD